MRSRSLTPALTAAFAFCAVAAAPALGQEIVLDLDPARTTVEFKLDATLHSVHGSFKLKRGAIRFDPATGKIAGEIVVDATTGESGNEGRDRKMHQSVLESQRYPEIVFTPDHVEGAVAPQGASQVQVHGSFRIHGATHDITLPVRIQMTNRQAVATTHFTIPYVKWGLKNPSTLLLRVGDKVDIDATAYTR
ncbi:MAG: YceI family protein [Bryobacteraceae bacterium]|jgi:polyisoprenoid-binding protein YceI